MTDFVLSGRTYDDKKEVASARVNDTRGYPNGSAKVSLYVATDSPFTYWTPAQARKIALLVLTAADEADTLNGES